MDFKDLLINEYKFWESFQLTDSFLYEDNFFYSTYRDKEGEHFNNHVYNGRSGYNCYRLYRGRDGIERYQFPPEVSLTQYVDMANDLMNDVSDVNIEGWVDNYFNKVIKDKPIYIKKRPSTLQISQYNRVITLPHEEYVAYQINDRGERKILSYGLIEPHHWSHVLAVDKPFEKLPKSELDNENKEPVKPDTKEEIPQVLVYYIDTEDKKLKTKTMSKYDAQRAYSQQWNNIENTRELIYKIENVLYYPPNSSRKKQFWIEQENKYGVDLFGTVKEKIIDIFEDNGLNYNDDILDKFIKVYSMKKLRNASKEKIIDNFDIIMMGVEDFYSMKLLQKDIKEHYFKLQEGYLTEANRQQLLQKSRNAKHYKNISKGKNRYERRMKSKISATVRDYNNIQMDQFFKQDIFEIKIPVMGETDVYEVSVRINGILKEVQKQVQSNKGILEFKVIIQSLMKVLNIGDVYINCTCEDFKYRLRYWATKNKYVTGQNELRPSDITNPHDDLGAGCKHILLILANLDWCVKVASVINNYIKYCKEHLEQAYADYIFPKVYGIKYDKAVQMNLFYDGMLPEDKKTMDEITQKSLQGKDKQGKFIQNNPYKFQKKDLGKEAVEDNPLNLNLEEPKEKELKIDTEVEEK